MASCQNTNKLVTDWSENVLIKNGGYGMWQETCSLPLPPSQLSTK